MDVPQYASEAPLTTIRTIVRTGLTVVITNVVMGLKVDMWQGYVIQQMTGGFTPVCHVHNIRPCVADVTAIHAVQDYLMSEFGIAWEYDGIPF